VTKVLTGIQGSDEITPGRSEMGTLQKKKKDALILRLYVAGNAPNSLRAIENVKVFFADQLFAGYELEIVDLVNEPLRALADGIIVTPTLVKVSPAPTKRLIGNLSDAASVVRTLARE
jgi:circadian clock protein KaiB